MTEIVEPAIKICSALFVVAFTSVLIVGMISGAAFIIKWSIQEIFKDE